MASNKIELPYPDDMAEVTDDGCIRNRRKSVRLSAETLVEVSEKENFTSQSSSPNPYKCLSNLSGVEELREEDIDLRSQTSMKMMSKIRSMASSVSSLGRGKSIENKIDDGNILDEKSECGLSEWSKENAVCASPATEMMKQSSRQRRRSLSHSFLNRNVSQSRSVGDLMSMQSECNKSEDGFEHKGSNDSLIGSTQQSSGLTILTINVTATRGIPDLVLKGHGEGTYYCKFRPPGKRSRNGSRRRSLAEKAVDTESPLTASVGSTADKLRTQNKEMGKDGTVNFNEQFDLIWKTDWRWKTINISLCHIRGLINQVSRRSKVLALCSLPLDQLAEDFGKGQDVSRMSGWYSIFSEKSLRDNIKRNDSHESQLSRQLSGGTSYSCVTLCDNSKRSADLGIDSILPCMHVRMQLWKCPDVVSVNMRDIMLHSQEVRKQQAMLASADAVEGVTTNNVVVDNTGVVSGPAVPVSADANECLEVLLEKVEGMDGAVGNFAYVRLMLSDQRKDSTKMMVQQGGVVNWDNALKFFYKKESEDKNMLGVVYCQTGKNSNASQSMGLFNLGVDSLVYDKPEKRSFLLKQGFCGELTMHILRSPWTSAQNATESKLWTELEKRKSIFSHLKLCLKVISAKDLRTRNAAEVEKMNLDNFKRRDLIEKSRFENDNQIISVFPNVKCVIKLKQTDAGRNLDMSTSVCDKSLNPKWNDEFLIDWHLVKDDLSLFLELYDEVRLENLKAKFIGKAEFTFPTLVIPLNGEAQSKDAIRTRVPFDVGSVEVEASVVDVTKYVSKSGSPLIFVHDNASSPPTTASDSLSPVRSVTHLSPNMKTQLVQGSDLECKMMSLAIVGLKGLSSTDLGWMGHKMVHCRLSCGEDLEFMTDSKVPDEDNCVSWTNFFDIPKPNFAIREVVTPAGIVSVLMAERPVKISVQVIGYRKKETQLGSVTWNMEELRTKETGECWIPVQREYFSSSAKRKPEEPEPIMIGLRWIISPDFIK